MVLANVEGFAAPLSRASFALVAAALLLAPIPFGSVLDWSRVALAASGLAAAGLALLAVAASGHTPRTLKAAWPAHLGFAVILLTTSIQGVMGLGVAAEVQVALLESAGLWGLFTAVLLTAREARRAQVLIAVIVAGGLIEALYGAAMVLSGTEYVLFVEKRVHMGSATGTYISRNNYAAHVAMALCFGVGLMLAHLDDMARNWRELVRGLLGALVRGKGAFRIVLIVMVVGLVLSRSRMGNGAFFTALTVCTFAGALLMRRLRPQLLAFALSVMIVDVFVIGSYFGVEKVVDRMQQTSLETEQRDEVAAQALVMFLDRPWLGFGAGAWDEVYPRYRGPSIVIPYEYAHNDYLQIAGEYGVVGLAGFALVVCSSAWAAIGAMRTRRRRVWLGTGFGGLMMIVYWLIHATVDLNAYIPSLAALFVVGLGLCWVARSRGGNEVWSSGKRAPTAPYPDPQGRPCAHFAGH